MSWEYQSKEAALNFSRIRGEIPKEVLSCIFEQLRVKNNKTEALQQEDNIPEFDSMLDVGCGSGGRIAGLVPYFRSITAIDSSEAQIALAKEVNPFDNITYLFGGGEDMPVPNASFDLATFIFSAYYMDMEKVEKELDRVLKPDGLAVLYCYLIDGIDLMGKNPDAPMFPELSASVMDLWHDCLKIFEDHAVRINHPAKDYFNKCEKIYQNLHVLNKWTIDDIKSYEFCSLDDFLSPYSEALPFFRNIIEAMDQNPIKTFGEDLKKLWEIPNVPNKDISVRITCSTKLIFLDRKKS